MFALCSCHGSHDVHDFVANSRTTVRIILSNSFSQKVKIAGSLPEGWKKIVGKRMVSILFIYLLDRMNERFPYKIHLLSFYLELNGLKIISLRLEMVEIFYLTIFAEVIYYYFLRRVTQNKTCVIAHKYRWYFR